jgi:hypothetical protein
VLKRAADFLRPRYPLKLDFCRMTLDELTSMMGRIIREDRETPDLFRPVVAIGHTKDLTDLQTVDSLLSFLHTNRIAVSTFDGVYAKLSPQNVPGRAVLSRAPQPGKYPRRTGYKAERAVPRC